MTELLVVIVLALVVIAASAVIGSRLGIASPLVLVAVGVAASFIPAVAGVEIEPEWILEGLLPPLLYSSAVSLPAMNFRREFGTIGGLSVLLVLGTSLVLGLVFAAVIPGLGFGWGVALGAILSPTDAVATSIIKQRSASQRIVAILDGESLLNDATALVLLRTAVLAAGVAGTGFSFWGAVGTFAYSVVVAVIVGLAVGALNLLIRKRVGDPTVNTVISFTVPFLASVPVTLLGGSGLVAAVVAGLVTGVFAPRMLTPQTRLSDSQNWRTVELVLEGIVFLTMGLQIRAILLGAAKEDAGILTAVLIAALALAITLAVRAAYIAPLLGWLHLRVRRAGVLQDRLREIEPKLGTDEGKRDAFSQFNRGRRDASDRQLASFARRVTQGLGTIAYFLREPLGWRQGALVVWAGMRGAVTVAAAQTLPGDTPVRSTLILIAFVVAAASLLLQGGTVGLLVRRVEPSAESADTRKRRAEEVDRLFELLRSTSESIPAPPGRDDPARRDFETERRYRLAVITAQRSALLDARDNGTFDADLLEDALANLDATQIDIELRGTLVA